MKDLWPILLQYVVPAVLGLVAGVVGSLFGPLVQWAVETRRNRQNYRRELIQSWRKIINESIITGTGTADESAIDVGDVARFTETPEYSVMKRYFSAEARQWPEKSLEDGTKR